MTVRNVFAERSVCLKESTQTSLFDIAEKIARLWDARDKIGATFSVTQATRDRFALLPKEDAPLMSKKIWLRNIFTDDDPEMQFSPLFDFSSRNTVTIIESLQF